MIAQLASATKCVLSPAGVMPPWIRVLRALFVAYVTATVVHIGWIMAHEPFSFDAWNVAQDTGARPFSVSRFFDYWRFEYTHSNPRLGQAFTYLAYKLEYFAVIATPLAFVALALAVFVLGAGRWPGWRRGRDLALWAIALGFLWFALPQIGKTMFCRAYGANYLYGAAIQLWFLVPLRLAREGRAAPVACAAYALAGIAAGMCNEHTGPALCAFMIGYAAWTWYRTERRPNLAVAGALGVLWGFKLIFFAPGQGQRYEGLAQRVSLVGRLFQRGLVGNLDILRDLVLAAAPLLLLLAIVTVVGLADPVDADTRARRRGAVRLIALVMVAGTAIAATIFVSPKLGPRFFLLPMALLLAGFIALADTVLTTPRRLAPFVAIAVLASGYAATRTLPLFARVSRAGEVRLAALEAARPGTVFTAEAFEQVEDSWWFLGDDFRDVRKRELVAKYFDLGGVVFRASDPNAPLGVTDVRLVARPSLVPAGCLDEHGGFELGTYRGLDVASIHKAMVAGVDALRARLGTARLDALELAVAFTGERPALPRPTLLVGRWTPARFEGWAGAIVRKTRATTRDVVIPKDLPADMEMFVFQVGGEVKRLGTAGDPALQYVPWRNGVYWALACRPTECFVLAALRVGR
jgi:hypothetical protein